MTPNTKKCKTCGKEKPLSEFGKSVQTKDGLNYTCRDCCNKRAKAYREKNPKNKAASVKKWHDANQDKVKKIVKEWQIKNPERQKALSRKYYDENLDKIKEYMKDYNKNYKSLGKKKRDDRN